MVKLQQPDVFDAALRSHLAAIVESSDDAIIGETLDGIVTSCNRGAERIYGYTATEMIGKSLDLLVPPDREDEIPGILKRIGDGERIEHYGTKRRRKDGTIIDISLTVSPIKDEGGRVIGASTIARDVTLAKRAEEALQKVTDELARSNLELQRFAYVASHDLQEPARTVASFCELLSDR